MTINLGGFSASAYSALTHGLQSGAAITNYLQNPTPGIDQNYALQQISGSSSPRLTAQRIEREGADQQRAMTEFDRQRQLGRREVAGRFSSMRNDLQRGIAFRGMGRSGFAAERMGQLGAQEGGALADVEAKRTEAIAEYKRWQEQVRMERSALRRAQNRSRRKKSYGAMLAAAGLIAAPFTGGMSLGLTATGANMYGSA